MRLRIIHIAASFIFLYVGVEVRPYNTFVFVISSLTNILPGHAGKLVRNVPRKETGWRPVIWIRLEWLLWGYHLGSIPPDLGQPSGMSTLSCAVPTSLFSYITFRLVKPASYSSTVSSVSRELLLFPFTPPQYWTDCLFSTSFQLTVWLVPSLWENAIAISFVGFFLGPIYPTVVLTLSKMVPPRYMNGAIGWITW